MKHLRKFENVQTMNTTLANSTIGILGLAYEGSTPVMKNKSGGTPGPDYSEPFYVENITQQSETLTIAGFDLMGEGYLEFTVEYSTDGTAWSSFGTTGETPLTRTLQPGDKVYLRATADAWWVLDFERGDEHGCIINGVSKVGGNVMSLLYGSSFTGNETTFPSGSIANFARLFNFNRNLVSASELILPATTLTNYCYFEMFHSCSALTTAPELPATTMAPNCYESMFSGCTSLTTAPALSATILTESCYISMFGGCTSLTSAPALPATILTESCYGYMFSGCTSLTSAPALPATTMALNCYNSMFETCTSLTTVPELPATTLASRCYYRMFHGCTALTSAPELPATTLAENCYGSMFETCTSLTTVPELPATTLTNMCYYYMFDGCTHLNYIKCLATDISASSCTSNWVRGVASTGTFVKNPNMSSWTTGDNGIPSGWTVQEATE